MKCKALPALLCVILMSYSCGKDGFIQDPVTSGDNGPEVHAILSLEDGEAVQLSHFGESRTFTFTASEAWVIQGYSEDVQKWLDIYPTSGRLGTTEISVSCDPNVDADHIAELSIMVEGGSGVNEKLSSFSVEQKKIVFRFTEGDEGTGVLPLERFNWKQYVREKDNAGAVQWAGERNKEDLKTFSITGNVGWQLKFLNPGNSHWYTFETDSLASAELRQDVVKVLPSQKNMNRGENAGDSPEEVFRNLYVQIVPLMPKGKEWVPMTGIIEPLELDLSQDYFLFNALWQGDRESVDFSMLRYDEASGNDDALYSINIKSDSDWEVSECPSWLTLWKDSGATEELTGVVTANRDEGVTIWATTKYANPSMSGRSSKIEFTPTDEGAEGETDSLLVNQKPFEFDLTYGGKKITAEDMSIGVTVDAFESGDETSREFGISASGKVDESWIFGDGKGWLSHEVSFAGDRIIFRIAPEGQNLEFHDINTPELSNKRYSMQLNMLAAMSETDWTDRPITIRPPFEWFETDDVEPQLQLQFTQKAFVFDVEGWDDDSYLCSIGNKSTIDNKPTQVAVSSSGSWRIEVTKPQGASTGDWAVCKINNRSQTLNGTTGSKGRIAFPVGADAKNNLQTERSATVTFISELHEKARRDDEQARITKQIKQNEYLFKLLTSKGGAELTDLGSIPAYTTDNVEFFIQCSGAWTVTHCPGFLNPPADNTNDDVEFEDVIAFSVNPNFKESEIKDQYIEIKPETNMDPKRISIAQDAFRFSFDRKADGLPAYSENNINIAAVTLTKGVTWQLKRNGEVIDLNGQNSFTADGNEYQLTPRIETNLNSNSETIVYTVEVTNPVPQNNQKLSKTLEFPQEGFVFTIGNDKLSFKELDDKSAETPVSVTCSGPWAVKDGYPDWLHPAKDGEGSVKVWTDMNFNYSKAEGRTATLTLESTEHKSHGKKCEREITVSQERFFWDIKNTSVSDKFSYNFEAVPQNVNIPLSVNSSGDWTVTLLRGENAEVMDDHFEASLPAATNGYYAGDETGTRPSAIKFTPKENFETDGNKVLTIRIQSKYYNESDPDAKLLRKDVTVSQKPFIWEVTADPSYEWNPTETSTKVFTVKSAGEWYLKTEDGRTISDGSTIDGCWHFTVGRFELEQPVRVSVSVDLNNTRKDRNLSFTVISKKHESNTKPGGRQQVDLKQKEYELYWNVYSGGKPESLDIDREYDEFEPLDDATNRELSFESSGDWNVSIPFDARNWVYVTPTSGRAGNGKIWVSVAKNTNLNYYGSRSVSAYDPILISSNGLTLSLTLSQKEYEFKLDKTSIHLKPEGDTKDVVVTCSGQFIASCADNWITMNGKTGSLTERGDGNTTVKISAAKDASGSDQGRYSKVRIESYDIVGLYKDISISQTPYILRFVSEPRDTTISPDGGVVPMKVESTVQWNAKSDFDWLTLVPSSGKASDEPMQTAITATVSSKNPDKKYRENFARLYPSDMPNTGVDEIRIRQDAFLLEPAALQQFKAVDAAPQMVTVYSSNQWELDKQSSSGLLDYTITDVVEGNGSETGEVVTVGLLDNTKKTAFNNEKLVFVNKAYAGVKREVSFSQKAFEWNVNPSSAVSFATLPLSGAKQSIKVTTSGEYEAYLEPDTASQWLDLSGDVRATDSGTITIQPKGNNLGDSELEATLVVRHSKYGNDFVTTIPITQKKFFFELSSGSNPLSEGDTLYYHPDGGTRTITVRSCDKWEIKDKPDWLTRKSGSLSGNGGETPAGVELEAKFNSARELREKEITVTCGNGEHNVREIHITMVQDVFDLSTNELDEFIEVNPQPQSFSVYSSGDWTVAAGNEWIHVTPHATKTDPVTVTVDPNYEVSPRNDGKVTVTYTPKGFTEPATREVTVKQKAYSWNGTEVPVTFAPVGNSDVPVSVTSSGNWKIESVSESWVLLKDASGSGLAAGSAAVGNGTIKVNVQDNDGAYREATVVIRNTDNSNLSKTITIKQSAFEFSVTPSSFEFAAVSPSVQTLNITCSGGWTISGVPDDWLLLKPGTNGNDTETRSLLPKGDYVNSNGPRSATIRVSSDIFPNTHYKDIEVSQANIYLEVPAGVTLTFDADGYATSPAASFTFVHVGDVDVSCEASWVHPTVSAGNGTATVTVTVDPSDVCEVRTAEIIVTHRGLSSLQGKVTVTQEAGTFSISNILGMADGSTAKSEPSLVTAVAGYGFIASDGTKAVYVFTKNTEFNGVVNIGDMVTFTGVKAMFKDVHEINGVTALSVVSSGNNVTYPSPKDITAEAATYNSTESEYISMTGTVSINGDYINVIFDGVDPAAVQGTVNRPPESMGFAGLAGKKVKITGYFGGIDRDSSITKAFLSIVATSVQVIN